MAAGAAAVGGATAVKAAGKIREKARRYAAHMLEASPDDIEVDRGRVPGQGLAREEEDAPGDRLRARSRVQPAGRHGALSRRDRLPRHAELHVAVRDPHRPRRGRRGHRRGRPQALRRRRRRRQEDQPADRRRSAPRRDRPGRRPGAVGGSGLRRRRPAAVRHDARLRPAARLVAATPRARRDGHSVAGQPARREGRRRGRRDRQHRRGRERRHRRAQPARDPSPRHAADRAEAVARDPRRRRPGRDPGCVRLLATHEPRRGARPAGRQRRLGQGPGRWPEPDPAPSSCVSPGPSSSSTSAGWPSFAAIRAMPDGGLAIGALATYTRSARIRPGAVTGAAPGARRSPASATSRSATGARSAARSPTPIRPRTCRPSCWRSMPGSSSARSPGERVIAAGDFFEGAFATDLAEDELLTEIRIPAQPDGAGMAFRRLEQRASGYSIVGVAAVVGRTAGSITTARIGITGVADAAYRASAVEAALIGTDGEAAAIAAAAEHAAGRGGGQRGHPRRRGVPSGDGPGRDPSGDRGGAGRRRLTRPGAARADRPGSPSVRDARRRRPDPRPRRRRGALGEGPPARRPRPGRPWQAGRPHRRRATRDRLVGDRRPRDRSGRPPRGCGRRAAGGRDPRPRARRARAGREPDRPARSSRRRRPRPESRSWSGWTGSTRSRCSRSSTGRWFTLATSWPASRSRRTSCRSPPSRRPNVSAARAGPNGVVRVAGFVPAPGRPRWSRSRSTRQPASGSRRASG